jgi:hypothetical protein
MASQPERCPKTPPASRSLYFFFLCLLRLMCALAHCRHRLPSSSHSEQSMIFIMPSSLAFFSSALTSLTFASQFGGPPAPVSRAAEPLRLITCLSLLFVISGDFPVSPVESPEALNFFNRTLCDAARKLNADRWEVQQCDMAFLSWTLLLTIQVKEVL